MGRRLGDAPLKPSTWPAGAPAVRLFVGGDPARVRGEPVALHGDRCFTAAGRVCQRLDPARLRVLLDSGAFSDRPARRLTPEAALERQLRWEARASEARASEAWGAACRAHALVSYDRLIDEKWDGARRRKERWTVAEADAAVRETAEAARYLAGQRERQALPRPPEVSRLPAGSGRGVAGVPRH